MFGDYTSSRAVLAAFGAVFTVYIIQIYVRILRIPRHRGPTLLISPSSLLCNLVSRHAPYVMLSIPKLWMENPLDEDSLFYRHRSDIVQVVSLWPSPYSSFEIANPGAIKDLTSFRHKWPKPVDTYVYERLGALGKNVVTSEGDDWKRHRKIINPAFSEPNNRLVWNVAVQATLDFVKTVWKDSEHIIVEDVHRTTMELGLNVIGPAGFGFEMSFDEDSNMPPAGHSKTFKDALHDFSATVNTGIVCPNWALGLTKSLRTYAEARSNIIQYVRELIEERRGSNDLADRHDLFSSLLEANANWEDSATRLSDDELIGNVFILLLAGHETSAVILSFALGLLALYQDEQDALYREIIDVLPDGREPSFEDIPSLSYCSAVIFETLRLFPPVPRISKRAAEDAILPSIDEAGNHIAVHVPKGSAVEIRVRSLHQNPLYWEDPSEFKPKRFLKDWNRDAFITFSDGARACIGRRFAETELVAMLTVFISLYEVGVKEDPRFVGETFEQRKARVLATKMSLTTIPEKLSLTFKRRAVQHTDVTVGA